MLVAGDFVGLRDQSLGSSGSHLGKAAEGIVSPFFGGTWGCYLTYPLVNSHITMENHHFLMGKSTISMAIFNSKLLVYQRVTNISQLWKPPSERDFSSHV